VTLWLILRLSLGYQVRPELFSPFHSIALDPLQSSDILLSLSSLELQTTEGCPQRDCVRSVLA